MVAATMWWYEKGKLVAAIIHAVRKFIQRRGYNPTIVVVPTSEQGNDISKALQAAGIDIQVGYRDKGIPPQYFYLYPVITKRSPKLAIKRRAL